MKAVYWLKARYVACRLVVDGQALQAKKEPAILSFHYKNSGFKVHTMSYSVLTAYSGSSNK